MNACLQVEASAHLPLDTQPVRLEIPGRWFLADRGQSRDESIRQLRQMAELFGRSGEAVTNLYLRMVTHIRDYELDPAEVNEALTAGGFPPSRISEIKRVAYADLATYLEYSGGRIGFRVALARTRLYQQAQRRKLEFKRRQLRKASARLIKLISQMGMAGWEYGVKGYRLQVVAESKPVAPPVVLAREKEAVKGAS